MSDRPIIFSAPMVNALLEGRKTETRRVLKATTPAHRLPYLYGDRLWVREGFCWVSAWGWRYRADNDDLDDKRKFGEVGKWRSPIHMPRSASRLTLTVTDVRVQRLHDITEADAVAEGVESGMTSRGLMWKAYGDKPNCWVDSARLSYIRLWESIHGPGAWDANPWVVALTFTAEKRNIDAGDTP